MIEPIITELNLELVDVEYLRGAHWYLRIYIDKDGGVDIDDCATVSQRVSEVLDKKILFPKPIC